MMKKMIIIMLFFLMPTFTFADVKVEGHYRSDGTYVKPHYRSDPNSNFHDNWSTKPNVNPHTGKVGTKVTPPNHSYDRYRPRQNRIKLGY